MFRDSIVHKGTRFKDQSILDGKTHFKSTETFHYTHFTSGHPPSVKNVFVKGEALRILRTNSSKDTFEENISKFQRHLRARGYRCNLVEKLLPEIKFTILEGFACESESIKGSIHCFTQEGNQCGLSLHLLLILRKC